MKRRATPSSVAELRRLRQIEHLAWHLCESSSEAPNKVIDVDYADFKALSSALPMEHPSHDGLPNGHRVKK